MDKLFKLLKFKIKSTISLEKIKKMKKINLILFGFAILYFGFSLTFSITMTTDGAINTAKMYGLTFYLIPLFFVLVSFFLFQLSIFNTKTIMYKAKDNDILLSLPIDSKTILMSRVLTTLLWNFLISLFIMLPMLITYAVRVSIDFNFIIMSIFTLIILPIIPTILASIFGYIIAFSMSKANASKWIEYILSFGMIIIFAMIFSNIEAILMYVINNFEKIENIIKYGFYSLYLIIEMFSSNSYISLLLCLIINFGLFYIFINVLSLNYKKLLSRLNEKKAKSKFEFKHLRQTKAKQILFIKEAKRYFSSPIYVFNTLFGVIVMLFGSFALFFTDKKDIVNMMKQGGLNLDIFPMIIVAITFIAFLSNTSCASISIEGKNLWILKSLPVKFKSIIISKIMFNFIIIIIPIIISILAFSFAFGFNIIELLILILVAVLSLGCSSMFGMIVNLKFPKLDAVDDTVIVKRSLSVLISTVLPLILIITLGTVYTFIEKYLSLSKYLIIIFGIIFILNIIQIIIINIWAPKRLQRIN